MWSRRACIARAGAERAVHPQRSFVASRSSMPSRSAAISVAISNYGRDKLPPLLRPVLCLIVLCLPQAPPATVPGTSYRHRVSSYALFLAARNSPASECGTKSSLSPVPNTSTARLSRNSPSLSFFARTSAYKLHHTEQFPCLGSISTVCWISSSAHLHSTRAEYVPVNASRKMLLSRQHRLAAPSPPTLADSHPSIATHIHSVQRDEMS